MVAKIKKKFKAKSKMALVDREQAIVDYYNQNAVTWVEGHGGLGVESYWRQELVRFSMLLPHGRILEIGSGAGNEARVFLANGYRYIGIDPSEGLLEIARSQNPQGEFRCLSVYDLAELPENSADGFWSAATLLHVPKPRITEALRNIARTTRKGGIGFISIKKGEGEVIEEDTGRSFYLYTGSEFEGVLKKANMKVLDSGKRTTEGKTVWLVYYLQVEK